MARLSAFLYAAALALACVAPSSASAKGLLSPTATPLSVDKRLQLQADPRVIRWRVARWNADAVFDANATFGTHRSPPREAPAAEEAAPLALNLFDDVAVKAHVSSAKTLEGGSRFLFGALEEGGHFSLFRHGSGIVRGEIHSAVGGYVLHSETQSGQLLIVQTDLSKLASCGTRPRNVDAASTTSVAEMDIHWRTDWESDAQVGNGTTIDMLIAYTQEAEDRIGGPDNMRAKAEYDVAYANQLLENSGLAHRQIRLAGLVNVADRDPSLGDYHAQTTEREKRIRFTDLLAALRSEHRADVTSVYITRSFVAGYSTGGYFNDWHWRSACANSPNPALCYYNVRQAQWGNDIDHGRLVRAGAGYIDVRGSGLRSPRTLAHEWGHEMTLAHERYNDRLPIQPEPLAVRETDKVRRQLRPFAFGHTNTTYLPQWCQWTIMSYASECSDKLGVSVLTSLNTWPSPHFSNPRLYYPRPTGLDASYPDVPMGVPGDWRTSEVDGPTDASRVIDEVWDIVANLSEPPIERLAGACNEGDVAADVLSSRLPARVPMTFAGTGRTYRVPVSAPAVCLDDVALRGQSSSAAFGVAASGRSGEHRLSVVATEPHDGACVSPKRAVVTAELWDAVEEFPPEVIRQRVPGVSPVYLIAEQRSAHSFCKGAPARHHLRGLGDFDGDGRSDALLRHADGHWLYEPIDERNVRPGGAADLNSNPAVSVAGIGDFNGDGKDDVLMRRANGSWRNYLMDGPRSIAGGGGVALPSDEAWQVEGIGDFDRDGRDDVLLRSSDGRWQMHHMDGRTVVSSYSFRPSNDLPAGWVAGVGDFDGNGTNDLLWRLADGTWRQYSNFPHAWSSEDAEVSLPKDSGWAVAGIADFNGDGKADVLLRHEDGRWHYYAMDGRAVVEETVPALPADPLVWLAGVGDTNGDGKADVLTRRAHGAWRVYRMDGGRVIGESEVGLIDESGWGVLTGGPVAPVETTTALPVQPYALGADATLDLSDYFVDDQTLSYEVHSTDVDVARASVTGDVLTLMPVSSGRATITVTARDPDGNTAVQRFSVVVSEDETDDAVVDKAARGSAFRDCAKCPEMVVAPAGWFMMGAQAGEAGSDATERPRHRVHFAAPFAIGAYEVTMEQWNACVDAGGCGAYQPFEMSQSWKGLKEGESALLPVARVNWDDAVAFADWLSTRTGQAYRLPSEAEWEYAARAGTKTPYHFGETLTGQANYASVEVERWLGQSRFAPSRAPVGWFAPNSWGLHDVHGNVREWTQDCWNTSYDDAPTDGGVWESGDCGRRVVRGGHWLDENPLALRSAKRQAMLPRDSTDKPRAHADTVTGFRVARSLSPIEAVAIRIPAQTLSLGTDATLDLAAHFGDDQALSYEVRSSDAEVVLASVSGGTLTLRPVATGDATVTVTAQDENGNTATQTVPVEVWLRDCAECPAMVVVPAGTFTMGAPESEPDSYDIERPQRTVSVPSFAAGAFEVTFDEWNACVADGGCDGYRPDDRGWGLGQRPVVDVSWQHAQRYVEWLSQRSGYRYRLLSEAEWEYAARAGTETPFHTGETITEQQANFDGHQGQTTPVGSYAPNAFGLHDMHGNLMEWVQDCYTGYDAEGARVDGGPVEGRDGCSRVLRGGSWAHPPRAIRSAARVFETDHYSGVYGYFGFRVARDVFGVPSVVAPVPDRPLALGADATLDLSAYFSDDQALIYEAESSDADVVRVQVISDGRLLLSPVADGRATVTITVRDPDGNVVRQTFQAIVSPDGQVGRRFRDCPRCPEMVVVPAGFFMMGSPPEEEGGPGSDQSHERPQHRVDFARPFAIGLFEVTFEQWDACLADGGCGGYRPEPLVGFGEPNHPILDVSWNDAQAYVEWLSTHTGQPYRLPSDAEWEYATRAGTTTPFHFGETIRTDQANYDGEVPSPRRSDGEEESSYAQRNPGIYRHGPVPVASLPANPWGLHEVHGNVSEWTQDCSSDSVGYAGWPADGSALESGDCESRSFATVPTMTIRATCARLVAACGPLTSAMVSAAFV